MNVGGQAVIEGVMMIAPEKVSVAVRDPDGNIIVDVHQRNKRFKKNRFFKWFFIRGIVALSEMLYEGINGLNYSAKIALKEDPKEKKGVKENILSNTVSFLGIIIALAVFLYLPLFIASKTGLDTRPVIFNLFTGGIRIVFFILYILIISFIPDIKRLFQYHGAEHKSIFCWEDGKPLTQENCSNYSTRHPRCGTSFIFVVFIVAIIFYAIADTFIFNIWGLPSIKLVRLLIHLLLLPFLIGFSYEIIRFAGNHKDNFLLKILLSPGLAFQYITTKEPSPDQLEVGFAALKAALNNQETTINTDNGKRITETGNKLE